MSWPWFQLDTKFYNYIYFLWFIYIYFFTFPTCVQCQTTSWIWIYLHVSYICFTFLLKLSTEELERRRIRRERNKMAAAKCRNRRRELTDTLQNVSSFSFIWHFLSFEMSFYFLDPNTERFNFSQQTDQLEDEKSRLQKEIAELQKQKEKLELVFEAHKPICKVQDSDSDSDSNNDLPSLSGIKIEPADPDLPGPSGESKSYTKSKKPKPKPKITIPPPASASTVTSVPLESESLHTPVLISTPSLTPFSASLVFSYPSSMDTSSATSSQALSLAPSQHGTSQPSRNPQPCGFAHRRSSSSGDQSDHSLNSPTILTLWFLNVFMTSKSVLTTTCKHKQVRHVLCFYLCILFTFY